MAHRDRRAPRSRIASGCLVFAFAVTAMGCLGTEGNVLTPVDRADSDHDDEFGDEACTTLECPNATLSGTVFCGHVIDLETSEKLTESSEVIVESPPLLRFFDSADFAENRDSADVLAMVEPDGCGRFATTVPPRANGEPIPSVVIMTGESGTMPGDDMPYRPTISVVETKSGVTQRPNVFALRTSTDRSWGELAGQGDEGIASKGPLLAIFIDTEAPAVAPFTGALVEGVTVTLDDMILEPQDFYFGDTDPMFRRSIDEKRRDSGPSGTGILIVPGIRPGSMVSGAHLDYHSAESSEMLAIEGLVQVQEIILEPGDVGTGFR